MPLPRYLPHLLYSTALISITIHLISKKAEIAEQQAHAKAQITILESIIGRLKSGENVLDAEIVRLRRLTRDSEQGVIETANMRKEKDVDWKSVVFGRRTEKQIKDEVN